MLSISCRNPYWITQENIILATHWILYKRRIFRKVSNALVETFCSKETPILEQGEIIKRFWKILAVHPLLMLVVQDYSQHWTAQDPFFSYFLFFVVVVMLSHVWLFYDPMNCNTPCSSVHGIFHARILEWVAISSSKGSSWSRDGTHISCTGGWIL